MLLTIFDVSKCSKIHSTRKPHHDNRMPHPSGAQIL